MKSADRGQRIEEMLVEEAIGLDQGEVINQQVSARAIRAVCVPYNTWFHEEMERGTTPHEFVNAITNTCATILGTFIFYSAKKGQELAALKRLLEAISEVGTAGILRANADKEKTDASGP